MMEECDRHGVSWTMWPSDQGYTNVDYNLTFYRNAGYDRPFATAVAGAFQNMSFDVAGVDSRFTLCYTPDVGLGVPTLLHASSYFYPTPPTITAPAGLQSSVNGTTVALLATQAFATPVCVSLAKAPIT
jgi:hypothetical protein